MVKQHIVRKVNQTKTKICNSGTIMLIRVNAFCVKILSIKVGMEVIVECPSGKKTKMKRVNCS